jgi:hypothetical protein
MNIRNFLKFGLFVFFMVTVIANLTAEIKEGIVVDKRPAFLDIEVYIRVERTRPYDHIIRLANVDLPNYPGMGLDMMTEKGTIIIFDDEGMEVRSVAKYGDQRRIISIDGISVLEMFPDRQGAFPYAQRYEQNRQSRSNDLRNSPVKNILPCAHLAILPHFRRYNSSYMYVSMDFKEI